MYWTNFVKQQPLSGQEAKDGGKPAAETKAAAAAAKEAEEVVFFTE
jgi:hypothetical protein